MGLTSDQLSRLNNLEYNLGYNFLRDAIAEGYTQHEMIDGVTDVFTDQSGVDTGTSTGEVYDATNDYYATQNNVSNFLIESDESNGSTTFTDESGNHSITDFGGISHSTAQSVHGTSSVHFDGVDDTLRLTVADDWDFDTEDFTIEAYIYLDSITGSNQTITAQESASASSFGHNLTVRGTGEIRFQFDSDGNGSGVTSVQSSGTVSATTWTHVAIVNDSGTIRLYIDGEQDGTVSAGSGIFDSLSALYIGSRAFTSDRQWFAGYMQHVKIIKGTCLYTGGTTFTPRSIPWVEGVEDMTVVSNSLTANSTPSTVKAVILHDPVDAVTLNTDAIFSVSRDGGTTFTDFTLTKEVDYGTIDSGTVEVLASEELSISAQPSGTSMVWKFTTANAKEQRLHGVSLQWK